eukprot:TRINITY_DN627_c0_g1_i2.p1 TRINITY_DN627_c0_g1~~TRINITY_DN627_c0_g1_i2.p1  ORF type:complete len:433 (+),score=41.80 TRINITY_DN627_c0_g1_i2:399-1697(+)
MDDHYNAKGFRKERLGWMRWSVIILVLGVFLIVCWNVKLSFYRRKTTYGLGDSPFRYKYEDYIRDLSEREKIGLVAWNTAITDNFNDPRKHFPPQNETNLLHLPRKQLLVGVFTSENRRVKRNAARETWIQDIPLALQQYNVEIKYTFVVGNKNRYSSNQMQRLEEEERINGDIIYTNTEDVYKKMAFKLYDWLGLVYETQSTLPLSERATFIMKLDDDSYLNVENVARILQTLPTKRLRYGFIWYDAEQMEKSKYYDKLFTLGSYFPPYAAGPGHIISADLLEDIISIKAPYMLQNDDINIDLWLYSLDIIRVHDDRWHGGYNLCCGNTRKQKSDFFVIVNARPNEYQPIREFIHNENINDWKIQLDYLDCNCYDKVISVPLIWIILLGFIVILIAYYYHRKQQRTHFFHLGQSPLDTGQRINTIPISTAL